MIKEFNKVNLKNVREDISAILSKYAKENGIELKIGNISFNAGSFTTKMEAKVIGAKTLDDVILESIMSSRGLKKVGMDGRILVGYNSRRHAYPFSYVDNGKQFKCNEATAKMYFGK